MCYLHLLHPHKYKLEYVFATEPSICNLTYELEQPVMNLCFLKRLTVRMCISA